MEEGRVEIDASHFCLENFEKDAAFRIISGNYGYEGEFEGICGIRLWKGSGRRVYLFRFFVDLHRTWRN